MHKLKYPNSKVGLTSFKKAKPNNVKKISETNKRTCLYQICCNASIKAESLRSFVASKDDLKSNLRLIKQEGCDKDDSVSIFYNISQKFVPEKKLPELWNLEA